MSVQSVYKGLVEYTCKHGNQKLVWVLRCANLILFGAVWRAYRIYTSHVYFITKRWISSFVCSGHVLRWKVIIHLQVEVQFSREMTPHPKQEETCFDLLGISFVFFLLHNNNWKCRFCFGAKEVGPGRCAYPSQVGPQFSPFFVIYWFNLSVNICQMTSEVWG